MPDQQGFAVSPTQKKRKRKMTKIEKESHEFKSRDAEACPAIERPAWQDDSDYDHLAILAIKKYFFSGRGGQRGGAERITGSVGKTGLWEGRYRTVGGMTGTGAVHVEVFPGEGVLISVPGGGEVLADYEVCDLQERNLSA